MSDVSPTPLTDLVASAARNDRHAAAELLPVLYAELRKLARSMMATLPPGETLQPTALVHEAYLRLVGNADPGWEGRPHFFGAAACAMRQILVDRARHKSSRKAGGGLTRVDVDAVDVAIAPPTESVLSLHQALTSLERVDAQAAKVAELRYFAGLSVTETASILGLAIRTAEREWAFARSYLAAMMRDSGDGGR